MALTPKQQSFVNEYLIDLNATQAAIRAGYSEKTAKEQASRLLSNVNVAAAVDEAIERRTKRTEITQDAVLQELAKIGFGNLQNIYGEDGALTPIHELPPEVAATITEVTEKIVSQEGQQAVIERKYKVADKRGSLELLGKHLKLFTDKAEVSGPGGGPIENKWTVEIVGTDKGE